MRVMSFCRRADTAEKCSSRGDQEDVRPVGCGNPITKQATLNIPDKLSGGTQ